MWKSFCLELGSKLIVSMRLWLPIILQACSPVPCTEWKWWRWVGCSVKEIVGHTEKFVRILRVVAWNNWHPNPNNSSTRLFHKYLCLFLWVCRTRVNEWMYVCRESYAYIRHIYFQCTLVLLNIYCLYLPNLYPFFHSLSIPSTLLCFCLPKDPKDIWH